MMVAIDPNILQDTRIVQLNQGIVSSVGKLLPKKRVLCFEKRDTCVPNGTRHLLFV